MGYVRTAGMSTAARRRRRRTALVLTLLLAVLVGILFYAVFYYQGLEDQPSTDTGDTTAGPTAPVTAAPELTPGEITVNVFNATQRSGLAGTTATALGTYGYTIARFDNDPLGVAVENIEIRHGADGEDHAQYLRQSLFPEATLVLDQREDSTIDLVLGAGFSELPPAPAGDGG